MAQKKARSHQAAGFSFMMQVCVAAVVMLLLFRRTLYYCQ